jgi:uridine kinase
MKSTIIGIAGGTGSGKSTFTNRLKDFFGDQITIIYYDNYYWPHDNVPFEERKNINYDHPDAFETDLLISQLRELKAGHEVSGPVYDYTLRTRSDETLLLRPSRVILVEGILALQNDELRDLMDIKIFVEADADERILRRVIRDVKERGRDVEGIVNQYLATVKPMHYLYVEPTKAFADIIINSGRNDIAFDLVRSKIISLLDYGM